MDMISAADIMKNRWNDYSGTRKQRARPQHTKPNKNEDKEEKATEEKLQESSAQKSKLREGTCYQCGNPGHIYSDFSDAASSPKDKWPFKPATQHLFAN